MALARLARRPIATLLVLLWIGAIVLAMVGLGSLPLRDWDEGIVARVALETSLRTWPDNLMPTYWWEPYRNKPPGVHLVIAACIGLWRLLNQAPTIALPPEWVIRIGPALISTTLVPLIGWIQWQLRPGDRSAVLAAAGLALTLLPLARHGRLAMLDGCQLVAMAAVWLGLLQSKGRRWTVFGWSVGAGAAGSALLLLKAPAALPILLGTMVLRLLDRDLSRRQWLLLSGGLLLGLIPGLGWHLLHGLLRGPDALEMWLDQGIVRVHRSLEGHGGGPWEPILEVLEGGGPWLLLWPFGMVLAWQQRHQRWGRWCLGLTLLTASMVLPLQTQLPWYSLLLWPSFCLVGAPVLVALVRDPQGRLLPARALARQLPRLWRLLGTLLLLLSLLLAIGVLKSDGHVGLMALLLGLGLVLGSWLLQASSSSLRKGGAITLVAGIWFTLLLLMASPLWLWELQESWPAPAVAAMVRGQAPSSPTVLALQDGERPSLSWYAGQRIVGGPTQMRRALHRASAVGLLSTAPPDSTRLACSFIDRSGSISLYRCFRRLRSSG